MSKYHKVEFELSNTNKTIYYKRPEILAKEYPTQDVMVKTKGDYDREFIGKRKFVLYIPGEDARELEDNINEVIKYLDKSRTEKRWLEYDIRKVFYNQREVTIIHRWIEMEKAITKDRLRIMLKTYKFYSDDYSKKDIYEMTMTLLTKYMFYEEEYPTKQVKFIKDEI